MRGKKNVMYIFKSFKIKLTFKNQNFEEIYVEITFLKMHTHTHPHAHEDFFRNKNCKIDKFDAIYFPLKNRAIFNWVKKNSVEICLCSARAHERENIFIFSLSLISLKQNFFIFF